MLIEFHGTWKDARKAACTCENNSGSWISEDGYKDECSQCGAAVVWIEGDEFRIVKGKQPTIWEQITKNLKG